MFIGPYLRYQKTAFHTGYSEPCFWGAIQVLLSFQQNGGCQICFYVNLGHGKAAIVRKDPRPTKVISICKIRSGMYGIRTRTPRFQISILLFHGIRNTTSGARYINGCTSSQCVPRLELKRASPKSDSIGRPWTFGMLVARNK